MSGENKAGYEARKGEERRKCMTSRAEMQHVIVCSCFCPMRSPGRAVSVQSQCNTHGRSTICHLASVVNWKTGKKYYVKIKYLRLQSQALKHQEIKVVCLVFMRMYQMEVFNYLIVPT